MTTINKGSFWRAAAALACTQVDCRVRAVAANLRPVANLLSTFDADDASIRDFLKISAELDPSMLQLMLGDERQQTLVINNESGFKLLQDYGQR
jgi:hypothetical protein